MRVVIKTAGARGIRLKKRIEEVTDIQVAAFTDSDGTKWNTQVEGLPVWSEFQTFERFRKKEFDKIILGTELPANKCRAIVRDFLEIGFNEEDIWLIPIEFILKETDTFSYMTLSTFSYIYYLEFHLTNTCNLNCHRCSHFIPLIPKGEMVVYRQLKKDLKQFKTKVPHINEIRIMGGEPLMSDDLADCCQYLRDLYPYANIYIVTNGILLQKKLPNLRECILENNVILDITLYPPVFDRYDDIIQELNEGHVKYRSSLRTGFVPMLFSKENKRNFRFDSTELSCECYNLYQGKLYPCPIMAYIKYFNMYYATEYPEETECVSIYEEMEFQDFYRYLTSPAPICNYCNHFGMTRFLHKKGFEKFCASSSENDWYSDNK